MSNAIKYSNPFQVGIPVKGSSFFGREALIKQAEKIIETPGSSALTVRGQRRIGKTSFLFELKRRLGESKTPVVYMDLMSFASKPLGELLKK